MAVQLRVMVTGSGGAPGANFMQSLRESPDADRTFLLGTDVNRHHLVWARAHADEVALVPHCDSEEYVDALNDLCERYDINFIHSQPDGEVVALSAARARLKARMFLPSPETIAVCQDKEASGREWYAEGLSVHPTWSMCDPLPHRDDEHKLWLHPANQALAAAAAPERPSLALFQQRMGGRLWLRASRGAGGRGSTLVENVDTALHWMRYWRSRGCDWHFIAQEYLPGRDYAFQSVWEGGEVVVSQARERIEYLYPHLAPSGRTGTPIVARTVHDERVNGIATAAVRAIDSNATGVFCVDLREDHEGVPVPTEINAGRFFTTSLFFTRAGCNMPWIYVRLGLGLGLPVETLGQQYNAVPADLYWMRHVDCPAQLISQEELDALYPCTDDGDPAAA